MVIFRENSEDIYAGIEWMDGATLLKCSEFGEEIIKNMELVEA